MTQGRRLAARALMALGLLGAGRSVSAQSITISLSATANDSVSPAPVITVVAEQVPADAQPASITFVASMEGQFRSPFFVRSRPGTIAQFQLDSLLPQRTMVFLRAQVLDRFGVVRAERIETARVHDWLALSTPDRPTNSLFSRQPRFEWNSPAITLPPGPWVYTINIFNVGQNRTEREVGNIHATSYVPDVPLDACTSFKWSVTASAENGGRTEVTVVSRGTFVIFTAECPSATLLFQNFPNPFGYHTSSDKTCFRFDLAHRSTVKLTIYDLKFRQVKSLVPGLFPAVLDSGAYGRQAPGDQTGCDPRLSWDGRDDRGRTLPTGVYIAVLEADGKRDTKKIAFRAP